MFRENAEVLLRHFQFNNNDRNKYKNKSNAQNDSTFKLGKSIKTVYMHKQLYVFNTLHKVETVPNKKFFFFFKGPQYIIQI